MRCIVGFADIVRYPLSLILDNLIAQKRARPVVAAMPRGCGEMKFSEDYDLWNEDRWNDPKTVERNLRLFEKALLNGVMPKAMSLYNMRKRCGQYDHPDRFGWGAGESSALEHLDFGAEPSSLVKRDRTIWIVCGRDEKLLESNRKLTDWLRGRSRKVDFEEPGGRCSILWREGLVRFASIIP